MPKYKVTYYREYEVETDCGENNAIGIADQKFADDVRETLFEDGGSRITDLFNFNVEIIKKNGEIKREIEESGE